MNVRNSKVDQTVSKYKLDEFGAAVSWEREFPAGQTQDCEVKRHRVDERYGKNLVIRVDDDTCSVYPCSLQQDPW